jgi:hypothetical protein
MLEEVAELIEEEAIALLGHLLGGVTRQKDPP